VHRALKLIALWAEQIGPKEVDPTLEMERRWWTFPRQEPVMGYFGAGPLLMVGDQPSTDPWPEGHPSRRLLYGTLIQLRLTDAHLTDVIKLRGKGSASRKTLPPDFEAHASVFRREIEIIQPQRIIAFGENAERLLRATFPEVTQIVRRVLHFSYAARWNRQLEFVEQLRAATS
jgi:uracil-DNA glycosylase